MKRVGRYTISLETAPKIAGYASVVGKKEKEGPLGSEFDRSYKDTSLGESSWEKMCIRDRPFSQQTHLTVE